MGWKVWDLIIFGPNSLVLSLKKKIYIYIYIYIYKENTKIEIRNMSNENDKYSKVL